MAEQAFKGLLCSWAGYWLNEMPQKLCPKRHYAPRKISGKSVGSDSKGMGRKTQFKRDQVPLQNMEVQK